MFETLLSLHLVLIPCHQFDNLTIRFLPCLVKAKSYRVEENPITNVLIHLSYLCILVFFHHYWYPLINSNTLNYKHLRNIANSQNKHLIEIENNISKQSKTNILRIKLIYSTYQYIETRIEPFCSQLSGWNCLNENHFNINSNGDIISCNEWDNISDIPMFELLRLSHMVNECPWKFTQAIISTDFNEQMEFLSKIRVDNL